MTRGRDALDPAVVTQVERLGGAFRDPGRTLTDRTELPEPLRCFLVDVRWPKGARYASTDSSAWPQVRRYTPGYVGVDAGGFSWLVHNPGAVCIGMSHGGNYLLFILADDPRPANPEVYRLDHDPGDEATCAGPLSAFLSSLSRETQKR